MRYLVLTCSDRKSEESAALPAIERYDGPMFRVLRRYLRAHVHELSGSMEVVIVSAMYGIVDATTPLLSYDLRMTKTRAKELQPAVMQKLRGWISPPESELFLAAGRDYLPAIEPLDAWVPSQARLTVASGGSGKQQQQLAAWLDRRTIGVNRDHQMPTRTSPRPTGQAVIRGVQLILSTAEIEVLVQRWVAEGDTDYMRTQHWLAQVGPYRVSPKWLVSRLSGVPVSLFAADEARRVLLRLGIPLVRRD